MQENMTANEWKKKTKAHRNANVNLSPNRNRYMAKSSYFNKNENSDRLKHTNTQRTKDYRWFRYFRRMVSQNCGRQMLWLSPFDASHFYCLAIILGSTFNTSFYKPLKERILVCVCNRNLSSDGGSMPLSILIPCEKQHHTIDSKSMVIMAMHVTSWSSWKIKFLKWLLLIQDSRSSDSEMLFIVIIITIETMKI